MVNKERLVSICKRFGVGLKSGLPYYLPLFVMRLLVTASDGYF